MPYSVYILSSKKNGVLYIGVTNDLQRRVAEHKEGIIKGFSQKYVVKTLIYHETYDDPENAILREKRLKKWNREWKIRLIEEQNPTWRDLYADL